MLMISEIRHTTQPELSAILSVVDSDVGPAIYFLAAAPTVPASHSFRARKLSQQKNRGRLGAAIALKFVGIERDRHGFMSFPFDFGPLSEMSEFPFSPRPRQEGQNLSPRRVIDLFQRRKIELSH
jgi:hypothetical protein